MIHQRTILKAVAYAILLCFTSLTGAQPLYAVPANTQLPTGPHEIAGGVTIPQEIVNNTMNITQKEQTSVITWENFSIGADATVNFSRENGGTFNSFNYVNGGNVSEIYGQLNAIGGNIFIANPSGVQIGNSAQINVGSLYATTKDFTNDLEAIAKMNDGDDIRNYLSTHGTITNPAAELMSLGSIISTENKVTFDGGRIIIDADRLYSTADTEAKMNITSDTLTIKTTDANDVIIGYDAGYKEKEDGTATKIFETRGDLTGFTVQEAGIDAEGKITTEYQDKQINGYIWIRDLFQLQNIAETDNLGGWYALRNSIDASYTAKMNLNEETGEYLGFNPIG